ncbi:MAG: hypothetical protein N3I35_05705 [Clostridia bacterium]|nr:hypothetical protein [Clostridia bacterium]
MIVAVVFSTIITLAGYLNAGFVFVSSSIGLVLGVTALFTVLLRKRTGWEDLAGPVIFLQIAVLSLITGMILEGAVKIIRRPDKKISRK